MTNIIDAIPIRPGYVHMWKSLYFFQEILGDFFVNATTSTLESLSVYGWKLCRLRDYPNLEQFKWKSFIRNDDSFLCIRRIEQHPDQTAVNHAIEKEYYRKMLDLKVTKSTDDPREAMSEKFIKIFAGGNNEDVKK